MRRNCSDFHVCRKCEIHHYDNCPDCFGFGLRRSVRLDGTLVPLIAREAVQRRGEVSEWLKPCPTCGSTARGVPESGVG